MGTRIQNAGWSRTACLGAALLYTLQASAQPLVAAQAAQAPQGAPSSYERIHITAGRSTVLTTDFEVTRIAVTNPAIADATVVQPREILIDGRAPGTISLIVWGADRRTQYDLVIEPAVTTLQQKLRGLFPGEEIEVGITDEAIVLSGRVSSNQVMLRAGEIAQASASKLRVINMLQLPGGSDSQQVMLQVRFAEVNRRALKELGVSFFTGIAGAGDWTGRVDDPAVPVGRVRRGRRRARVQRLPEPVRVQQQGESRRRRQGAAAEGLPPEPRRTEPHRLQRPGGELPGGRRVPRTDCVRRDQRGHA